MKSISIVTPSFNHAAFIEETLRSVLDQNYPALEYIVIDGASTDASPDIIGEYAGRLHYFVSEPDKGHGNALNKGFRKSSGEIMAWLNSDDKYFPWTFATVSEIFETFPDIDWIMGTPSWWTHNGTLVSPGRMFRNIYDYIDPTQQVIARGLIQQESVFWRRRLWDAAGGYIDESFDCMVDCELWTRFFLHADLWHLGAVLGGFRLHGGNRGEIHHDACVREIGRATQTLRARATSDFLSQRMSDYLFLQYDRAAAGWLQKVIFRDGARKIEA